MLKKSWGLGSAADPSPRNIGTLSAMRNVWIGMGTEVRGGEGISVLIAGDSGGERVCDPFDSVDVPDKMYSGSL